LIVGEVWNDKGGKNHRYYKRLKSLVRSLDIDDKIIFTGFRSDIPRFISAFDIVVLASSEPEPFGLVVIEGMAAGKPVIATASGGILDIIEDGVNGLLVPCKDSKAMAEAILEIVFNKDKAQRMGLAARRRVAERFTMERQIKAVEELYDSLLGTLKGT
jgi:glycosyltransferase involved in cell wall biosynthesis